MSEPLERPVGLAPAEAWMWSLVEEKAADLTAADRAALRMLCKWWQQMVRCELAMEAADPAEHPGAYKVKVTNYAIATDKVLLAMARFGLTPLDREKLKGGRPDPVETKVPTRRPTAKDFAPPAGHPRE